MRKRQRAEDWERFRASKPDAPTREDLEKARKAALSLPLLPLPTVPTRKSLNPQGCASACLAFCCLHDVCACVPCLWRSCTSHLGMPFLPSAPCSCALLPPALLFIHIRATTPPLSCLLPPSPAPMQAHGLRHDDITGLLRALTEAVCSPLLAASLPGTRDCVAYQH